MRTLLNTLIRLCLISVIPLGMGCIALPDPMPLVELGQDKAFDMSAMPAVDSPLVSAGDAGIVAPSADGSSYGDALTDGNQDGIGLNDGATDGVNLDGEMDGTTDALFFDAGEFDNGMSDAGMFDAGEFDNGMSDASEFDDGYSED